MANLDVATSLTSRLSTIVYARNGDLVLTVDFSDAAGVVRKTKVLRIAADGSGVYDERGVLLTANQPAALVANLTGVQTNVDAALTTLIAAGKITF